MNNAHHQALARLEAARASLRSATAEVEAAERALAETPEDPCAYECGEFKTWGPGAFESCLRVLAKREQANLELAGASLLVNRDEARALRRVLDAYLGDAR